MRVRELLGRRLQAQALLRVERGQLAELDAGRPPRRPVWPLIGVDLDERVVLLAARCRRRAAGGSRRRPRRPCAGCTS